MSALKKLICCILLLKATVTIAQFNISGSVTDSKNNSLFYMNIVLKNKVDDIINFTTSSDSGTYNLKDVKPGDYILEFSGVAYKRKIFHVSVIENHLTVDAKLEDNVVEIKEVIIQASGEIIQKKDTIVFNASRFLQGNEETVQDLLKKIPGISVDSEGTIKADGKEIEKIMVEGDDFFESGYKILSKNMPVEPIDKVELLNNYSNNKMLKGIEESDKVALNLKLKDKSKNVWFGNINSAYGYSDKQLYNIQSNFMNFSKKCKFYFITNFNNTGNDAQDGITHLIKPFSLNQRESIGNNQQSQRFVNLDLISLDFKKERINFNKAKLVSLNTILNPTDRLKIKNIIFFNWDETSFMRNTLENIKVDEIRYTNSEILDLKNKKFIGFGKIDINYSISKTQELKSVTKYNSANENILSNLNYNNISSVETLNTNNTFFDQKINFSTKLNNKQALLFTGRFIDEESLQDYSTNQFIYQNLFSEDTAANNINQFSNNKMQYFAFSGHFQSKGKNKNLLEIELNNEYRIDRFNSKFLLYQNDSLVNKPTDFQNEVKYVVNDLYIKGKYRYKIKKVSLVAELDLHQVYNNWSSNIDKKNQVLYFANPLFKFEWQIKNHQIITSYSYNATNTSIINTYNNYILTGSNTFKKGGVDFNSLTASTALLKYQFGNWDDRLFINTLVLYNNNHKFISTNTYIYENYTTAESIVINNRELLNISTTVDCYINLLKSNLKFDIGFLKTNYKTVVNDIYQQNVNSTNYNYGFELRSGFKGKFNYHIGTKWENGIIEIVDKTKYTNLFSFADFYLNLNKRFTLQMKLERSFFDHPDSDDNTYYFLDFSAKYNIIENKLTFSLLGKNLTNTEYYKNYSLNDLGSVSTKYLLLPRSFIFKLEYRF